MAILDRMVNQDCLEHLVLQDLMVNQELLVQKETKALKGMLVNLVYLVEMVTQGEMVRTESQGKLVGEEITANQEKLELPALMASLVHQVSKNQQFNCGTTT